MMQPPAKLSPAAQTWKELRANPAMARRWDWCALLRLAQAAHPDKSKIGFGVEAEQEFIRLGQEPHLNPPPLEIAGLSLQAPAEKAPTGFVSARNGAVWLRSFHFGMFGP